MILESYKQRPYGCERIFPVSCLKFYKNIQEDFENNCKKYFCIFYINIWSNIISPWKNSRIFEKNLFRNFSLICYYNNGFKRGYRKETDFTGQNRD